MSNGDDCRAIVSTERQEISGALVLSYFDKIFSKKLETIASGAALPIEPGKGR